MAYPSPPASSGGLVVWSTWRVRRALRQIAHPQLPVITPRLTAHGLRHTSATLMLASGIPPKVAAERLGHADPMLFTNLYSHVTPTMQREAAERIGSLLFADE
ncbi:MAG: tyrosine-type recombinase/integrase [Steroidobacteraceae bacterium]